MNSSNLFNNTMIPNNVLPLNDWISKNVMQHLSEHVLGNREQRVSDIGCPCCDKEKKESIDDPVGCGYNSGDKSGDKDGDKGGHGHCHGSGSYRERKPGSDYGSDDGSDSLSDYD